MTYDIPVVTEVNIFDLFSCLMFLSININIKLGEFTLLISNPIGAAGCKPSNIAQIRHWRALARQCLPG
jgi:hypothetical protein